MPKTSEELVSGISLQKMLNRYRKLPVNSFLIISKVKRMFKIDNVLS